MKRPLYAILIALAVSQFPLTAAYAWLPPNGVALCTATNVQNDPAIASDGAGGAIVVWVDQRAANSDIYAQRVNAMGLPQWPADGLAICTLPNAQTNPRIVADGSGGAIIVWEDFRNAHHYDVYAQRVNAAGAALWTVDGVPVCEERFNQIVPDVTFDGANGAIVTWADYRSGTADIYAQRMNALGVAQWVSNGVVVCNEPSGEGTPTIVIDGSGGAIVTWEDYRQGTYADIYAQRMNASGVAQWTANGVAVSAASDHQFTPISISDGANGVIAVWEDFRNVPGSDIYTQRMNGSGNPVWMLDGVKVGGPGCQFSPTLATDGASGAIIAWFDDRGPDEDIYAQRVNAAGTPLWTVDGVTVCTATGNQFESVIVSDGAQGAIMSWPDLRFGIGEDIFAQRLGPTGIPTAVRDTPSAGLTIVSNTPNPFTQSTAIDIALGATSMVSLEVFDATGRRVREMNLGHMVAGPRTVMFDGRDDSGRRLPSGVYFCRVNAGGVTGVRKIVITR